MSHLLEAFEIDLPAGVDKAALASLQQALGEVRGVDAYGQSTPRSLDPATLTVWVTLTGSVLTTLATAVPVVKQIIELCKRKGIKGAKLVLADGSVLQADEISADDLLKLTTRQ